MILKIRKMPQTESIAKAPIFAGQVVFNLFIWFHIVCKKIMLSTAQAKNQKCNTANVLIIYLQRQTMTH